MNEIVNTFLSSGDKFMPKMHLIPSGFTYSTCGPSTNSKEEIQILKEIGDLSKKTKQSLLST